MGISRRGAGVARSECGPFSWGEAGGFDCRAIGSGGGRTLVSKEPGCIAGSCTGARCSAFCASCATITASRRGRCPVTNCSTVFTTCANVTCTGMVANSCANLLRGCVGWRKGALRLRDLLPASFVRVKSQLCPVARFRPRNVDEKISRFRVYMDIRGCGSRFRLGIDAQDQMPVPASPIGTRAVAPE